MNVHDSAGEAQRLPLWRNVLESMMPTTGYGVVFSTEFMENGLKAKRGTVQFNGPFQLIREALLKHGFLLSWRGMKGTGCIVLPLDDTGYLKELRAFRRKSARALGRGFVLGTNIPLSILSAENQRRHNGELERLSFLGMMHRRSERARQALIEQDPGILKKLP